MKKGRLIFILVVLFLSLVNRAEVWAETQILDEFQMPTEPQIPGRLEGTGTHFELTNSDYLNITLDSSEPIKLMLESAPETVVIHIESTSDVASTEVTLSNLSPLTTYHKYEDDYHNHIEFTTDAGGRYTYTQDLSKSHLIFIQPKPSTVFLSNSGWSNPSVGTWNPATKTAVLTQDITETIQIDNDNIILDGNGHTITGNNTGSGVYLSGRKWVTIKNLKIKQFTYGIYIYNYPYLEGLHNLVNNIVSNNRYGIYLWFTTGNTVTNSTISNNLGGVCLVSAGGANWLPGNTIANNTVSGNTGWGIWLGDSNYNIITSNAVLDTKTPEGALYSGITLSRSRYNTITNNNCLRNYAGIYLGYSENTYNTISGNIVSNNRYAILLQGDNNYNNITKNTATNNIHGIYSDFSNYNTITENTVLNNSGSGIVFYQSHYNTVTNNTASNNGYGIVVSWSSYNKIYNNNFISNSTQALVYYGSGNVFNLTIPKGGNYWSNWTSPDNNNDGFVDYPYVFTGGQDNLPWARQSGWADKTPPTTGISLSGNLGNNGWYISGVQITLSATDNEGGLGIKDIKYSLDGTNWNTYTTAFIISSEGITMIYYRATDMAGNVEPTKNQEVKIDKTPPTINGSTTTAPNANGWYNTNVTVHFTANDTLSGVATITPDTTLSTEGAFQSITGTAIDNAGNSTSTTITGINIDKTLPEIVIDIPANGSVYILNKDVFASWSANDGLSGIASVTATVPNGEAIYTGTVGTKTFSVVAIDNAGNQATQTVTYYVRYVYSGVLQPINIDGSSIFKLGRTVPVRFQLQDANGNFIANAISQIYLVKINADIVSNEIEAISTSAATTDNLFRYDSVDNQYIFNLDTKTLSPGTWQIRILLDDGTSKYSTISLR